MRILDVAHEMGHEEVIVLHDAASGLRAVVAIHDTTLGPAVGGTRMRLYPTMDDAVLDALRLSRAMTFKAALAEMPTGGGKAVILGDPARDKTRQRLVAYARAIERMGGRFHTGPDMGIDPRDVAVMARQTKHVSHAGAQSGVDTADLTALGVLESIRQTADFLGLELAGLRVALQGAGQVGYRLAKRLQAAGARLVAVCDRESARADRVADECGATRVEPEDVYDSECDVFSPNAAGAVLNSETIPRLRARAVVGAANEQLSMAEDGDRLHERGIVWAPDYVVNAGGLLSLLHERGELDEDGVRERVRAIGPRVREILESAADDDLPPHVIADRIAHERLRAAREAKRARPLA